MDACDVGIYAESLILKYFEAETENLFSQHGLSKTSPLRVPEEHMTLQMLMDLRSKFPGIVEVNNFSKKAESKNGADWLWRIQTHHGYLHMLVQAKRIDGTTNDNAPWTISVPDDQHSDLKAAAQALNIEPIYCLYYPGATYNACDNLMEKWKGGLHKSIFEKAYTPKGSIFLVEESKIQGVKKKSKIEMNIDPLQPAGLSLSELLCCVLTDGGSGNSFNKPWTNMLRKDALTLSDLLETLRERNLKNVEGMVKLKI